MIQGQKVFNVNDKCIIDAIKASIAPTMRVHFIHVSRDYNKVVHQFVKYGFSLDHGLISFVDISFFAVAIFQDEFQSMM